MAEAETEKTLIKCAICGEFCCFDLSGNYCRDSHYIVCHYCSIAITHMARILGTKSFPTAQELCQMEYLYGKPKDVFEIKVRSMAAPLKFEEEKLNNDKQ